jgi:uncharacterized coiled-coil DUF342 family protein
MSNEYEIKGILESHVKASDAYREKSEKMLLEITNSIAKINTHHEYTQQKLKDHEDCLTELKDAHNKQKGAVWVFGLIGLGGFVELIRKWIE